MNSSLNVPNMRVCAMDIGSNSTRYMIADLDRATGRITVLFQGGVITRLGAGISSSSPTLPEEARQKTLQAMRQFFAHALSLAVADFKIVGTAALREAQNGAAFSSAISEETGYPVEIIDGGKEAKLLGGAIAHSLDLVARPFVALDIGGGSAQILSHESAMHQSHISLPLGAVRLTEKFLRSDPPGGPEQDALRDFAAQEWRKAGLSVPADAMLVGAGGAITTLAALVQGLKVYDHSKIHGYQIGRAQWRQQSEALCRLTAPQRRDLPGMQKGREDIIVAGILTLDALAEAMGKDSITISDRGVLYGILVERLKEL